MDIDFVGQVSESLSENNTPCPSRFFYITFDFDNPS